MVRHLNETMATTTKLIMINMERLDTGYLWFNTVRNTGFIFRARYNYIIAAVGISRALLSSKRDVNNDFQASYRPRLLNDKVWTFSLLFVII